MSINNTNMTEKKRMKWIFSGFYVASLLLLILTLTVFWDNAITDNGRETKNAQKMTMNQQLTNADQFLNGRMSDLQQLDSRFITLLSDSGIRANFEPTFNKIQNLELLIKKDIDSIKTANATKKNSWQFNEIVAPYLAAIDNRRVIDNLQKAVSLGSKQMDTDQQNIVKLKYDLSQRDGKSIESENEGKGQKQYYTSSTGSADLRLLRAQNEYLKSENRVLQMKNAKLLNNRDYDPYAVEQTSEPANNSNTPTLYRPKTKGADKSQAPKYQNQQ